MTAKIKQIIMILFLSLVLAKVMVMSNVVYCDTVNDVSPDIFLKFKETLYEHLKIIIKSDYIREKYGQSTLFTFIYIKSPFYIVDFIETLPLAELFIEYKYNTRELSQIIIDKLFKDLQQKKDNFEKVLVVVPNLIFIGKMFKQTLEHAAILNDLLTIVAPYDGNLPIITEDTYKRMDTLIIKKGYLENAIFSLPTGFNFRLEGDSFGIEFTFSYVMPKQQFSYDWITIKYEFPSKKN